MGIKGRPVNDVNKYGTVNSLKYWIPMLEWHADLGPVM